MLAARAQYSGAGVTVICVCITGSGIAIRATMIIRLFFRSVVQQKLAKHAHQIYNNKQYENHLEAVIFKRRPAKGLSAFTETPNSILLDDFPPVRRVLVRMLHDCEEVR